MIISKRARVLFVKALCKVLNVPAPSEPEVRAAEWRSAKRLLRKRPLEKPCDRMLGDWTLEARSRYLGFNDFSKDK